MDLLEFFNSIDVNEIKRFVNDGQEEYLHLEFKQVNHPSKEPKGLEADRKNISKCISGFANSDGGIIIWGVSTSSGKKSEPDTAKELKPISELKKFTNLLNRLEGQATTPTPKGVIHEAIADGKDVGFVKTFVPASENAPHMANFANKHYYKRSGDSFYQCEHYDIQDMFHRKQEGNLIIEIRDKHKFRNHGKNVVLMKVVVISNVGRNLVKAPIIHLKINEPFYLANGGLSGKSDHGPLKTREINKSKRHTYNGGQDVVIYPNMKHDFDLIEVVVDRDGINSLPEVELSYMIVGENQPRKDEIIKSKFKDIFKRLRN